MTQSAAAQIQITQNDDATTTAVTVMMIAAAAITMDVIEATRTTAAAMIGTSRITPDMTTDTAGLRRRTAMDALRTNGQGTMIGATGTATDMATDTATDTPTGTPTDTPTGMAIAGTATAAGATMIDGDTTILGDPMSLGDTTTAAGRRLAMPTVGRHRVGTTTIVARTARA